MPRHLSLAELRAGLPHIHDAPADNGTVEGILIRPASEQRRELESVEISAAQGTHGDTWANGKKGKPANPEAQICIMSARTIALIAVARDNWAPAGDNLFIDMDIRPENLPIGTRLTLGTAEIEITRKPHLGCFKFIDRYGKDAETFVNDMDGRAQRLRGVYGRVVRDGRVSLGDTVAKVEVAAEPA